MELVVISGAIRVRRRGLINYNCDGERQMRRDKSQNTNLLLIVIYIQIVCFKSSSNKRSNVGFCLLLGFRLSSVRSSRFSLSLVSLPAACLARARRPTLAAGNRKRFTSLIKSSDIELADPRSVKLLVINSTCDMQVKF